MDPAALASCVLHEIARDGVYGSTIDEALDHCAAQHEELDSVLRTALKTWVLAHPDIEERDGRLYASSARQWRALTNSGPAGSPIGDLAFQLLCLVSNKRSAGVSTVDAAKLTGQDPRSIFGRVQLLVDLKLIARFPVIEDGNSTHKLLFHTEAKQRNVFANAVDIERLGKQVVEFCKIGPNGLRLARDVSAMLAPELTSVPKSRRRPVAMRIVRILESRQCVRRVYMFDPNHSETQYPVVEYCAEYKPGTSVGSDAAADLDNESDESDDEMDLKEEPKNVTDLVHAEGPNQGSQLIAHTALPLFNQIFASVFSSRDKGIGTMDLTRKLTGKSYRKAFSKYLDTLTETRKQAVPEWGHLSLVRGMDFHHKVKFYRYFARRFFPQAGPPDPRWGDFPELDSKKPQPDSESSGLRALEARVGTPIPGACSIIRLKNGTIVPSFHGDGLKGDIICLSKGEPKSGGKKRGRPRKTKPKKAVNKADQNGLNDQNDPNKQLDTVDTVDKVDTVDPVDPTLCNGLRKWTGGTQLTDLEKHVSVWLNPETTEMDVDPQPVPSVASSSASTSASTSGPSVGPTGPTGPSGPTAGPLSAPSLTGVSLANQHRAELILKIVNEQQGAVVNGAALIQLFVQADSRNSVIDRKTINKVTSKLLEEGKLAEFSINANNSIKSVLYDPQIIPDPATSARMAEIKYELTDGLKLKHAQATKAAVDAVKSRTTTIESRALSTEQLLALKPRPERILTTKSSRTRSGPRQRFGPSAAEVLNLDENGDLNSKSKRTKSVITKTAPLPKEKQENMDTDWLLRAVIVYRSLYAVKTNIDWSAVTSGMPNNVTPTAAKKTWPKVKNAMLAKDANALKTKTKHFEELFMAHFSEGKLELLDKSRIEEAIPYYTQWWRTVDSMQAKNETSDQYIPLVRRLSNIKLKDAVPPSLIDPFSSLQSQLSVVNAEKLLASTSFGSVNTEFNGLQLSSDEMRIRSVIAADDGLTYTSSAAAKELSDISEHDAEHAIRSLERKRIIQWGETDKSKIPFGRPYILSDKMNQQLQSKINEDVPMQAKEYLDSLTLNDEFQITESVDENEMIVLLGLVTWLPGKHATLRRLNEKFGLIANDYKSRGIDKQEFECEIECKVDEYTMSTEVAQKVPLSADPKQPYLWQTQLLTSTKIWYKVCLKLTTTVLFRPGITPQLLAYGLQQVLTNAETYAAVEALIEYKALVRVSSGLRASANWYERLPIVSY